MSQIKNTGQLKEHVTLRVCISLGIPNVTPGKKHRFYQFLLDNESKQLPGTEKKGKNSFNNEKQGYDKEGGFYAPPSTIQGQYMS